VDADTLGRIDRTLAGIRPLGGTLLE